MAEGFTFRINSEEFRARMKQFVERIGGRHLLAAAGETMRGSIEQTFRDSGSPPGSWPPLAASTLKRRLKKGGGAIKMLIDRGRLKNSLTYRVEGDERLVIGTNVIYGAIHQTGGEAGRRGPFKKKDGRRPFIPARPFLVFRPEDPERIQEAMEQVIDQAAQQEGLR